jgi:hypothetical protein
VYHEEAIEDRRHQQCKSNPREYDNHDTETSNPPAGVDVNINVTKELSCDVSVWKEKERPNLT